MTRPSPSRRIFSGRLARRLRLTLAVIGIGLVSACGTVDHAGLFSNDDRSEAAARTFQRAYGNVQRYYVDDVAVRNLALSSLKVLHEVDETVDVHDSGGKLVVTVAEKEIANFSEPASDDPTYWGVLTSAAASVAFEAAPALKQTGWRTVTDRMLSASFDTLDAYSRYSTPEEAAREKAARDGFGGIGVTLMDVEGEIVIREVIEDSPAKGAGLLAGDRLRAAGGTATAGMTIEDVVILVRGPVDAPIDLSIDRDGQVFEATLVRQHIIPPTVYWHRDGDVGVIRITWFNRGTQEGVETAILDLYDDVGQDKLKGVILDLRGNPGGFLHHAVNIADMFIRSGEIVSVRGRHPAAQEVFRAHADDLLDGRPIVVLIDGNTASASEILASALQDSGRAVLVGSSTYGKGSVQQIFELPNAGEVKVTWARYYAPSGYSLTKYGVYPTLCTATGESDAETILANVTGRGAEAARNLRLRRDIDRLSPAERKRLSEACSWKKSENQSLDLDVARGLFERPGLFDMTQAATRSGAPAS
ncbi:MAG: S41 family peptidase [Alphaproteobacteria bacterium]|nr:S41 family peptidase [Alphaproteobacteria bacterium]